MKSFEGIRAYRPKKLYIAADGPRLSHEGENDKCKETRQAILDLIDWPCEVHKLFRENNLGCARAVYEAVTWMFEKETKGVIIEDDIITTNDFYHFCEDLLEHYQGDENVMSITGFNPNGDDNKSDSYYFTDTLGCWGWATWSRAWKKMDFSIEGYPLYSITWFIKHRGWIRGLMEFYYNRNNYRLFKNDKFTSWAGRWGNSVWKSNGFFVVPKVNLTLNIGMDGDDGAHYWKGYENPYPKLKIGKLKFPLNHKIPIKLNKDQQRIEKKEFRRIRLIGLRMKFSKLKMALAEKI